MWTENVFNLLEKHINTKKKGPAARRKWHLEKCIIVIPVSDLIDKDLDETNRENDLLSCVVLCHCQRLRVYVYVHNVQQTRLLHLEHLTG